jgi:NAD(P)-dependent dehydrogenase (short-subunit alcohol dehydrogenase family)
MNGTLTDRVAIVTGASRGIGAETARALARAGARVVLAARDESRLQALAAEITATGGTALGIPTDIGEPTDVERMIGRTLDAFGRLDIAFNNAAGGGHPPTPLSEVSIEDFDSALRVNLRGTFLCLKHEIAAMLGGDTGGAIVNMSSTAGLEAVGGLAAYVSTKHAIVGLTKTAALEYAPRGIRVNAICPGTIETPMVTDMIANGELDVPDSIANQPIGRLGRADEIAAAVLWLSGPAASLVVGVALPVGGGYTAR